MGFTIFYERRKEPVMLSSFFQFMSYVCQFFITYWSALILSLLSAVLELYIAPNIMAWYENREHPKYRRFSVMASFLILNAIVNFAINLPPKDSAQAEEQPQHKKNLSETVLDCGCIKECTCDSVTPPACDDPVAQTYVDSLMLSSEVRELSIDEIKNLNREDLALLRNAIFAMAGMQYDHGSKYDTIFQSYDWYHPFVPKKDFPWEYFNSYQLKNMNRIIEYEKSMGYRK